MKALRPAGFTLIESLVAGLLLVLFFAFYLEWLQARAVQSRHFGMLSQVEHVRRAALAYAADSRLQKEKADETLWPQDSGVANQGIMQLFQGGYLAPTFSTIYPGGRWVLETLSGKQAALRFSEIAEASVPNPTAPVWQSTMHPWLRLRYETPAPYGYGVEFERVQQSSGYWSRYMPTTSCQSDLRDIGLGNCVAMEFYLPPDSTHKGVPPYTTTTLRHFIQTHTDTRDIRMTSIDSYSGRPITYSQTVQLVDMGGSTLRHWRRLIVGGGTGFNWHFRNKSVLDRPSTYGKFSDLFSRSGDRYIQVDRAIDQIDQWNNMAGSSQTEPHRSEWRNQLYLSQVSGLYTKNLHIGKPWSRLEMELDGVPGFGILSARFWSAGKFLNQVRKATQITAAPRLYSPWQVAPSLSIQGTPTNLFFPAAFPRRLRGSIGGMDGTFSADRNNTAWHYQQPLYKPPPFPSEQAGRFITRTKPLPFVAINIGYAGFHSAVLGKYGLYTSNLRLGDRRSAFNTRKITYRVRVNNAGTVETVNGNGGNGWQAQHEAIPSYFTNFHLKNVRIVQNAPRDSNDFNCDPISRGAVAPNLREGLINLNARQYRTINCNHDHDGRADGDIEEIPSLAPGGPSASVDGMDGMLGEPQTAWQNFRQVSLMNGLLRRSDARLKRNIRPLVANAAALDAIRPYAYSKKADPSARRQIGLVAQEVNAHYPELVEKNEEGHLAMSYDGMVPVLWGHLQEAAEQDEEAHRKFSEQLRQLEQAARP